MRKQMHREARDGFASGSYYDHVEEGYDDLARTYDEEIAANAVGQRMRQVVRKALGRSFHSGDVVFEIGCGTGIDAIWLARQGIQVVATDISQGMIRQVQEKARTEGLSELIQCRKLAASQIGFLEQVFGEGGFDGGFSHAGALNMEPALSRVPRQIQLLLKRQGPFICSVINRTSLFEVLFYLMVFKPRKGFRRIGNVIPIPISRREPLDRFAVPARFLTPKEIIRLFQGAFAVEAVQGLQIFLPPANLADYYRATKPVFTVPETLEDWLSEKRPFNAWGNHTILTFNRR